jgi:hypothetical protein
MPRRSFRRVVIVGVAVCLVVGNRSIRAEPAPPSASIDGSAAAERHRIAPRGNAGRRSGVESEATGGWWLGTAGIALALAVCGGISVASRRFWPQVVAGGPLRVVGRTSLSPRHTVYLLKAGGRVLIVGTGPQGAPSLLGELDDPDDLGPPADGSPRSSDGLARGFDRRVGDDA